MVHNFISNVNSNVSEKNYNKNAFLIYSQILKDKINNPNTKIVLISGTPMINEPFELSLIFNLLRPNIFPKNIDEFNNMFINKEKTYLNLENKNMFIRRI